jgi:hypothetical protein
MGGQTRKNQKPRVITPGLLAFNQRVPNYTARQSISIVDPPEARVKVLW